MKKSLSDFFQTFPLLVYLIIFYYFGIKYEENPFLISFSFNFDSNLFIGVITSSSSLERAKKFHSYSNQHKKKNIYISYYTSDDLKVPELNIINLNMNSLQNQFETYPYVVRSEGSLNIVFKFFYILKDFLENNNYKYLIRLTDDVFINYPKIEEYLVKLDYLENSRSNNVFIQGCCLIVGESFILQGGSGYLLSKKSANAMFQIYTDIIRVNNNWEDWIISEFLQKLEPDLSLIASKQFLGHGLQQNRFNELQNKQYTNFQSCNLEFQYHNCYKGNNLLKDLIFFHQAFGYHEFPILEQILLEIPNNLYFFQDGMYSEICIVK